MRRRPREAGRSFVQDTGPTPSEDEGEEVMFQTTLMEMARLPRCP